MIKFYNRCRYLILSMQLFEEDVSCFENMLRYIDNASVALPLELAIEFKCYITMHILG